MSQQLRLGTLSLALAVLLASGCDNVDKCLRVRCSEAGKVCDPADGLCKTGAADGGGGADAAGDVDAGPSDGGGSTCGPANCSDKTSFCDNGTCRVCTAAAGCSGPNPMCDPVAGSGAGACVECLGNGDCAGATPVCSPTNTCVANQDGGTPDGGLAESCAAVTDLALGTLVGETAEVTFAVDTTTGSAVRQGSCHSTDATGREKVFRVHLAAIVNLTFSSQGSLGVDPVLYVRRAPCVAGAELPLACADATNANGLETLVLEDVPPGDYYLFVDSYDGFSAGPQTVTVVVGPPTPLPENDSCAKPQDITFPGGTNSVTFQADTTRAADDFDAGCATSSGGRDLVYHLNLAETQDVKVSSTGAPGVDPVLYLRSSPCETAADVQCANTTSSGQTEMLLAKDLAPGHYYLFVDSDSAPTSGPQTVTVSLRNPPRKGDTCADPFILFADGGSSETVNATTEGYWNDYGNACGTSMDQSGNELVYRFVTKVSTKVSVKVAPVAGDAGSLWPYVYLRDSADCALTGVAADGGGPGCVEAPNPGRPIDLVASNLPAGTYYLVVDSASPIHDGPFSMNVTLTAPDPAPANASCATAQLLSFTDGGAVVHGTTRGASSNTNNDSCYTAESAAGSDVVYRYATGASSAGYNARFSLVSENAFELAPLLNVRNVCSSTSASAQWVCEGYPYPDYDVFGLRLGIAPNSTEYVWVDAADGVLSQGPFALEVDLAAVPAPNDLCATAVTLPPNVSVSGSTLAAANDLDPAPSLKCGSYPGADVVYKYTAPSTGVATITAISQRGFDVGVYVLDAACAPATCIADRDQAFGGGTEVLTFNATAGLAYYVVVDYFLTDTSGASRGGFVVSVAQ